MTSYYTMTYVEWGYAQPTYGRAFVAPVTVRVTNSAGKSASAIFSSITPNLLVSAN